MILYSLGAFYNSFFTQSTELVQEEAVIKWIMQPYS